MKNALLSVSSLSFFLFCSCLFQIPKDYVYMQGCDPGVGAIAEFNPNNGIISIIVSNYGDNVWSMMRNVRKAYY